MKRLLVVASAIAAGIAVIAIVVYLLAVRGLPEEARAELNGYLANHYLAHPGRRFSVQAWPRGRASSNQT